MKNNIFFTVLITILLCFISPINTIAQDRRTCIDSFNKIVESELINMQNCGLNTFEIKDIVIVFELIVLEFGDVKSLKILHSNLKRYNLSEIEFVEKFKNLKLLCLSSIFFKLREYDEFDECGNLFVRVNVKYQASKK